MVSLFSSRYAFGDPSEQAPACEYADGLCKTYLSSAYKMPQRRSWFGRDSHLEMQPIRVVEMERRCRCRYSAPIERSPVMLVDEVVRLYCHQRHC